MLSFSSNKFISFFTTKKKNEKVFVNIVLERVKYAIFELLVM